MPGAQVIAPTGDLDLADGPAFRLALSRASGESSGHLVVDLSQVEFIDSTGLGAVVETSHRLQRQGRTMAVVAPRGSAAALLLTLSNLRRHLRVYETRSEALDT
jgi:anti-sigma B factor antagonist